MPKSPFPANATTMSAARNHLESIIERALELLDTLTLDPDLEDNGDLEPSLGWAGATGSPVFGDGEDFELEDSDFEPEEDTAVDDDACDCVPGYGDDLGWNESAVLATAGDRRAWALWARSTRY